MPFLQKTLIYKFWLILLYTSIHGHVFSQDFKLIDVNPSNYPIIEAVFQNTNNGLSFPTNFTKSDFVVTDSGDPVDVLEIQSPSKINPPLSIVLMLDVSGSMGEERMQIVKDAAINFINRITLDISEMAIASFNQNVMINCYFTRDRFRLINSIDKIYADGGTNYQEAFLNNELGAVQVAKEGENKKVVVFLTDGLSKINADSVLAFSKDNDITFYNLSVELEMPDELKKISEQSGGKYFEALNSVEEINRIFNSILYDIQTGLYTKVYWKSPIDCKRIRTGYLEFKGQEFEYTFQVPIGKQGQLNIENETINFGDVRTGNSSTQKLLINSTNARLELSGLKITGNAFSLTNAPRLPFMLQPDSTIELSVLYTPSEWGEMFGNISVFVETCPPKSIKLKGGEKERVNLKMPIGGETYSILDDTLIAWDGLRKNREVEIFYRLSDSLPWEFLKSTSKNTIRWITPKDTSKNAQVRVKPKQVRTNKLERKYALTFPYFSPVSVSFSPDNSEISLLSNQGTLFIVHRKSGTVLYESRGMNTHAIGYNKLGKHLSFGKKSATYNYSTFNFDNQVLNSVILSDGTQSYIHASIRKLSQDKAVIQSPLTGVIDTVEDKNAIKYAAISNDGNRAVTINGKSQLKIWDLNKNIEISSENLSAPLNKYILNPVLNNAVSIKADSSFSIVNLNTGNTVDLAKNLRFKKFSKSGSYIVAKSSNDSIYFIDSRLNNTLSTIRENKQITTTNKGYGMVYYLNDTITYINLENIQTSQKLYAPNVCNFSISPNDSKLLVSDSTGLHTVYNTETLSYQSSFNTNASDTYITGFSLNNEDIIICIGDESFELWSPNTIEFEEGTSGSFTLGKPSLSILDSVYLGEVYVNGSMDFSLPDIIMNNGRFSASILKTKLEGVQTFELVSGGENQKIAPGQTKGVEIRYSPKTFGKQSTKLRFETQSDAFSITIAAKGVSKPYKLLNNYHNFGEIEISESRDTVVPILINSTHQSLTIERVELAPFSDTQFELSKNKNNTILKVGDTLKINVQFMGRYRGKTSSGVKIKIANHKDEQIVFLGEVVAPSSYLLSGHVWAAKDSLPLKANVSLVDLGTNRTIKEYITPSSGEIEFVVFPERKYGVFASSKGFVSSSKLIDLSQNDSLLAKNKENKLKTDIYLKELAAGSFVTLNCIFFEFGTANILEGSFPELNKIVALLRDNPEIRIEIQGHTDNVGTYNYNYQLGWDRANAVKKYIEDKKVQPTRLFTKSFAFDKPVADNTSENGRAQNRRVEIMIK